MRGINCSTRCRNAKFCRTYRTRSSWDSDLHSKLPKNSSWFLVRDRFTVARFVNIFVFYGSLNRNYLFSLFSHHLFPHQISSTEVNCIRTFRGGDSQRSDRASTPPRFCLASKHFIRTTSCTEISRLTNIHITR